MKPQHLTTCKACGQDAGWKFDHVGWMPAGLPSMKRIVEHGGGIIDPNKPNQVGLAMYICNHCKSSEPDVPK